MVKIVAVFLDTIPRTAVLLNVKRGSVVVCSCYARFVLWLFLLCFVEQDDDGRDDLAEEEAEGGGNGMTRGGDGDSLPGGDRAEIM